ncbi:MAG: Tat pathway signal protein [Sulfurospirillaceae bacterium]|nr:Tat pathway signal protein [Sulfurospirillaceae bacterium]MDD2826775.1 Tat pathway signal protein [Sulfurospirillaceae bacterium]
MNESRRGFVKKAAVVGAVTAVGVVTAHAAGATGSNSSNGVVVGKSKKKEITYKKTRAWEDYYKSAM